MQSEANAVARPSHVGCDSAEHASLCRRANDLKIISGYANRREPRGLENFGVSEDAALDVRDRRDFRIKGVATERSLYVVEENKSRAFDRVRVELFSALLVRASRRPRDERGRSASQDHVRNVDLNGLS